MDDEIRSCRSTEVNRQAMFDAIEKNPSIRIQMLTNDVLCGQKNTMNILHEIGKIWKKTRWISHELTKAQMQKRVNVAQDLLNRQKQTTFLEKQLVTIDGK